MMDVASSHNAWFHGVIIISFFSCIFMALRATLDESAPQLVVLAISSVVSTLFICFDLLWNIDATNYSSTSFYNVLRYLFLGVGLVFEVILVILCVISRNNFGWRLYLLLGAKLSDRTVFDLVYTFSAAVSLDTQACLILYFTGLWFS